MTGRPDHLSIDEHLREIVRRNSRLEVASIHEDHVLTRDLGYDSLSFLTTLGDLEDSFGVEIPVEQIEELAGLTYGGLLARVRGHLAAD